MEAAAIIATLAAWKPLGYAAIFFALFFEGEIIIFTALFLTHQGAFDTLDVILVIVTAVALNDLLWHKLGAALRRHPNQVGFFASLERRLSKIASPLDTLLRGNPRRTLFAAKFAYGFMRPTLVRTGMIGMSTKEFIKYNHPVAALWLLIVGGLGYFSSVSLELLRHYFKMAGIAIIFFLAVFLILWHIGIKRFLDVKTDVNS